MHPGEPRGGPHCSGAAGPSHSAWGSLLSGQVLCKAIGPPAQAILSSTLRLCIDVGKAIDKSGANELSLRIRLFGEIID